MCIGLIAPGRCLNIDFLHEQLWFSINPDSPEKLEITEVYDILINNTTSHEPLEEILAMFPHDCTFLQTVMLYERRIILILLVNGKNLITISLYPGK